MRSFFLVLLVVMGASLSFDPLRADEPRIGWQRDMPAIGRFVKVDDGYLVPYTATIPGTSVTFEMQPIPGGKFRSGSPAGEAKRTDDEGPQFEVELEPFWIGAREVTWAEYKEYMRLNDVFKKFRDANVRPIAKEQAALVITAPSNLYDPSFTFQLGQDLRLPAVTMSQYAAKQYTGWLSGISGQFYRLPSEAEWEYACRAGSQTAYFFGDDPAQLKDYGWSFENSNDTTHKVGLKKPNPWGLFDMHGNVGEWTLDQYSADGYKKFDGKSLKAADAIAWPTKLFPRVVRGGCYDDEPDRCRSAARKPSHDNDWRSEDPNVPKSPWWFTSQPALGVGMRIVRPSRVPPAADRNKFWEADVASIIADVDRRIDFDGRGGRGVADPELPAAIKKLK